MKKNYGKGSGIAQYGIIITLIMLSCVVVFSILGQQISSGLNHLTGFYGNASQNVNENIILDKMALGTVEAGALGGSIDNPKEKCISGLCALDFGGFIFNGMPEDFGSFIETAGTSGGTDKLSDMLEVIADYLEKSGDTEGAEEYRKLANLGHFMGDVEGYVEKTARNCTSSIDYRCLETFLDFDQKNSLTVPENVADVLTNFNDSETVYNLGNGGLFIGFAKNAKNSSATIFENGVRTFPSYAMVKYYDKIMANPKYSDKLKAITTELYRNIADISRDQSGKVNAVIFNSNGVGKGKIASADLPSYDPLTGENLGRVEVSLPNGLNDIIKPDTSKYVDVDSALICVASGNSEDANSCHTK